MCKTIYLVSLVNNRWTHNFVSVINFSQGVVCSYPAGQDVVGVQVAADDFAWVKISFVHVGFLEAIVAAFDNRVKQFGENLVRVLVTGNAAWNQEAMP